MPSPPAWTPAPPLPRRSRSRRTRSGNARSSASTGVLRVLVMCGVHAAHARARIGPAALPAGDVS